MNDENETVEVAGGVVLPYVEEIVSEESAEAEDTETIE